jgi:hypothetical protein
VFPRIHTVNCFCDNPKLCGSFFFFTFGRGTTELFWLFFPTLKSERCSVYVLVPTYPGSEIHERVRRGETEEEIYGCGGVRSTGTRRVCACRLHHDRSNDMFVEEL